MFVTRLCSKLRVYPSYSTTYSREKELGKLKDTFRRLVNDALFGSKYTLSTAFDEGYQSYLILTVPKDSKISVAATRDKVQALVDAGVFFRAFKEYEGSMSCDYKALALLAKISDDEEGIDKEFLISSAMQNMACSLISENRNYEAKVILGNVLKRSEKIDFSKLSDADSWENSTIRSQIFSFKTSIATSRVIEKEEPEDALKSGEFIVLTLGRLKDKIELLEKESKMTSRVGMLARLEMVAIHEFMGDASYDLKKFEKALEWHALTHSMLRASDCGYHQLALIKNLVRLGRDWLALKKPYKAEEVCQEASALCTRVLGEVETPYHHLIKNLERDIKGVN